MIDDEHVKQRGWTVAFPGWEPCRRRRGLGGGGAGSRSACAAARGCEVERPRCAKRRAHARGGAHGAARVERAAHFDAVDVDDERAAPGGAGGRGDTARNRVGLMPGCAGRPAYPRFAALHVRARADRARGSARSHEAAGRICTSRALRRPTGHEPAFARVARAERARFDAVTDLRGGKPTARRSPARTIAHLFARVANAVTAAWVGGGVIRAGASRAPRALLLVRFRDPPRGPDRSLLLPSALMQPAHLPTRLKHTPTRSALRPHRRGEC